MTSAPFAARPPAVVPFRRRRGESTCTKTIFVPKAFTAQGGVVRTAVPSASTATLEVVTVLHPVSVGTGFTVTLGTPPASVTIILEAFSVKTAATLSTTPVAVTVGVALLVVVFLAAIASTALDVTFALAAAVFVVVAAVLRATSSFDVDTASFAVSTGKGVKVVAGTWVGPAATNSIATAFVTAVIVVTFVAAFAFGVALVVGAEVVRVPPALAL